MGIKNTLTKVGNVVKTPGFKVALLTGGMGLATAIININSQKIANDTAKKNLLAVKLQARAGVYDRELVNELLKDTDEGKEENTEETDQKTELKVVK